MKRYFIETSVIIDYLKGEKSTVEMVDKLEGELTSSYICLSELYEGIYRVVDKDRLEKAVLTFFSSMSEVFGADLEIAKAFGKIRARLKKEGRVIEDIDIFIAATCLAYNLTLVSQNTKHFERIKELEIYKAII